MVERPNRSMIPAGESGDGALDGGMVAVVALDLGWFEVDEDPQLDRGGPVGWAQRRGLFKVVLLAQLCSRIPARSATV
jgi:hypothetical protein